MAGALEFNRCPCLFSSRFIPCLELHEMDRRKDEFLAMLGYELRNPLAAIRNIAELMRRGEREQADPHSLDRCEMLARQVRLRRRHYP